MFIFCLRINPCTAILVRDTTILRGLRILLEAFVWPPVYPYLFHLFASSSHAVLIFSLSFYLLVNFWTQESSRFGRLLEWYPPILGLAPIHFIVSTFALLLTVPRFVFLRHCECQCIVWFIVCCSSAGSECCLLWFCVIFSWRLGYPFFCS